MIFKIIRFAFWGSSLVETYSMKFTKKDIYRILASVFGFALLIALFVREIPYNINTFNYGTFLVISIVAGMIAGILAALYFKRYADELIEKFQLFVALAIVGGFIFPILSGLVNRIYVQPDQEILIYIDTREVYGMVFKGTVSESELPEPSAYDIMVERDGGEREVVRFSYPKSESWTPGQRADIALYRGLLGVKFVYPD